MKLRPLHDRVIVSKRLEPETETASGIVISDNAAEARPGRGDGGRPEQRNDKGATSWP